MMNLIWFVLALLVIAVYVRPGLLFMPFILLSRTRLAPRSWRSFFEHQLANPEGLFGRFILADFFKFANGPSVSWALGPEVLDVKQGDEVLEIGFGAGYGMEEAVKKGARKVTGVEASPDMLGTTQARLKHLIERGNVELFLNPAATLQKNSTSEKLDDKVRAQLPPAVRARANFDVVWNQNVLYFFKDKREALQEWANVLKPGGKLGICGGTYESMKRLGLGGNEGTQRQRFFLAPDAQIMSLMEEVGLTSVTAFVRKKNASGQTPYDEQCLIGIKA